MEKQKILKSVKVLSCALIAPILNEDSMNLKRDAFWSGQQETCLLQNNVGCVQEIYLLQNNVVCETSADHHWEQSQLKS